MSAPAPKIETLHILLGADSEARIEITVTTDGLGAVDPPCRRAPTASELQVIARYILQRQYHFTSQL